MRDTDWVLLFITSATLILVILICWGVLPPT